MHATRSAWSFASKDVQTEYGFSTQTIADLNSVFLAFYSIGMFYVPGLGDRMPRNRAIFLFYSLIALM